MAAAKDAQGEQLSLFEMATACHQPSVSLSSVTRHVQRKLAVVWCRVVLPHPPPIRAPQLWQQRQQQVPHPHTLAATVLQQRQQLLLTAWLDELLVTVQRELVEREESQHLLRETVERQDEHGVAVPLPLYCPRSR